MCRTVVVMLSLLAGSSAAFGQTKPEPGTPAFFRDLTERRAEAAIAEDRGFYERLLAKDFVMVGDNGAVSDKAEYLDAEFGAKHPKEMQRFYAIRNFDLVTAHPDLAIVSYLKTEGARMGEQTFSTDARRLDTYAREEGEWHLIAMAAVAVHKPPLVVPIATEKLNEYAGRYTVAPGVDSVITVAGDYLVEQTTGNSPAKLLPVGPDTFFDPGDSPTARTVFRRDAAGKVVAEVYTNGDQEVVAKKSH